MMYVYVVRYFSKVCTVKGSQQTVVLSQCTALQAELNITQELTFAPSDTEKCVQFPIVDDSKPLEPNETLRFQLVLTETIPGVFLGSVNMTTITIQDDDSKSPLIQ